MNKKKRRNKQNDIRYSINLLCVYWIPFIPIMLTTHRRHCFGAYGNRLVATTVQTTDKKLKKKIKTNKQHSSSSSRISFLMNETITKVALNHNRCEAIVCMTAVASEKIVPSSRQIPNYSLQLDLSIFSHSTMMCGVFLFILLVHVDDAHSGMFFIGIQHEFTTTIPCDECCTFHCIYIACCCLLSLFHQPSEWE